MGQCYDNTLNLSSINNLDGALSKTVKIIDLSFRQSEVWALRLRSGQAPKRNPNRLRFLLILRLPAGRQAKN